MSHCRHRATLVKLINGQTTNYIANWLLDVDWNDWTQMVTGGSEEVMPISVPGDGLNWI